MTKKPETSTHAATALSLLDACRAAGPLLVYAAGSGREAQALHGLLRALQPDLKLALFPAWDTMPDDRLSPSASVMGARMGVLRWLTDPQSPPRLVITTADALLPRVAPRAVWPDAHIDFAVGDTIETDASRQALLDRGYVEDDLVDQPGEVAFRGQVIDIFPAAAPLPCRIAYADGRITGIRSYQPLTQSTEAEATTLGIDPAIEMPGAAAATYETFFDYAPKCRLAFSPGALERADAVFMQIDEAAQVERRSALARAYLSRDEWSAEVARRVDVRAGEGGLAMTPCEAAPRFAREKTPGRALDRFLDARRAAGDRIVVAGMGGGLAALSQRVRRQSGRDVTPLQSWEDVRGAPAGAQTSLEAPLDSGLRLPDEKITLVTVADLLGSRAGSGGPSMASTGFLDMELRPGDVVVHQDHGVAVLEGLDGVEVPDCGRRDYLRMRYADDAKQMLPIEDIAKLWRYGSEAEGVALDRLDRDSWAKRRDKVVLDIARSAATLVEQAEERRRRKAPVIEPPADLYERFVARFPFALTQDQATSIDAVLHDLSSGRPMNRLVCGDVGYGKTEVALRAAAAVAFSGRQVAILAPTTLLARQHLRSFTRRFAGLGVEIAELSRFVDPATARRTKKGLRDGSIRVVIGTHAICGKGVAFQDLGLVIIDEEQKFGARHKQQARALSEAAHALTLTATPIPRTLQASLVGLQDLSVIATPPFLRQPVRTTLAPRDQGLVRDALLREKRRGGQSFFVCPRIADLEPAQAFLREAAPELSTRVAHGQMKPGDMDAEMLAFAEGEGDVLLATSIVESGLDVPGANTLFVWDAARFGMAQLHQLRGRVGRGVRRAFVAFLTEDDKPSSAAMKRLKALQTLDHLGAGFAISARDLDLRGAGDLLGDDQAGHVKLIGVGLYQDIFRQAIAKARGEEIRETPQPDLNLGVEARIPDAYVAEPDLRLTLYATLHGQRDASGLDAFEAALADRFGPPPDEMRALVAVERLRLTAHELGLRRFDAGAQGMAATLPPDVLRSLDLEGSSWTIIDNRLVSPQGSEDFEERLALADDFLAELGDRLAAAQSPRDPARRTAARA
ncbi:MAG: helicase-related protein [Beijerinckiaceae bacterium]|nr:helicase-related protein [Beijerinckiaceae bacterium]